MIIHLSSAKKDEALVIANAIRNGQIGQAKGGLLVHEGTDADPRHLVEKLIVADPLPNGPINASRVKWKQDGMVIFVGKSISLLKKFETLVPGFTKQFGPITKLTISAK